MISHLESFNEWDPLKSVMVGITDHANWPTDDPVFALEPSKTTWTETPVPTGPVPDWIIEESNEDLLEMVRALTDLGIEVIRPKRRDFVAMRGMYNYCPRDRLIVWGDTIIDCAMMYPCRDQEIEDLSAVTRRAGRILRMPRNSGMVLDAANVLRLNDQWLFLESASGNRAAYDWLCAQLPEVKIELCNFYSGVHIDSTIVVLRPGLVVLNASRVTESNCPKMFQGWDKIWVTDVVPPRFYEYPYASKWMGLNMFSINPNLVMIDAAQTDLIKTLSQHGVDSIPLTLRHSRTLGGGFHCVTLDLLRSAE